MKNTNEIITAIEATFEKLGDDLSRKQSTILSGCLLVWFEQIRADQDRKTRLDIIESIMDANSDCVECGSVHYVTIIEMIKFPMDN